jgi:hypothetical protein
MVNGAKWLESLVPNARLADQEPDPLQDLMGGHDLAKGKDICLTKGMLRIMGISRSIRRGEEKSKNARD